MTTNQKGAIAESAVVAAALRLGIQVYRPIVEGGRYDLVFELGSRLLRVQCKWAVRRGDVINVRCYSSRRSRDGCLRRSYTAEEVDAIVAYCPDLDRCYLLPLERFGPRAEIQLRLAPARNNQQRMVNWADDFLIDRLLVKGP
jgi:hypothetical protein